MEQRRRRKKVNTVTIGYNLAVWLVEIMSGVILLIPMVGVTLLLNEKELINNKYPPDRHHLFRSYLPNSLVRRRPPPLCARHERVQAQGGGQVGGLLAVCQQQVHQHR